MSEDLKLSLEGCIQETKDGIRIVLNVKPRSKLNSLKFEFSELVFFTKELPVKGKANAAVVKFLSRVFEVSTSMVKIVYGQKDRSKAVEIKGISKDIAVQKLIKYLSKF